METIYKLQPNRSMNLLGFDNFGAAAALTEASASGFTVSGVFRDPGDFCVLTVWDAYDFFGHPRFKYLPDFDFSGMVLQFDVLYSGLQALDTVKYPTIDNTFLDVVLSDQASTTVQVPLWANAVLSPGAVFPAASGSFTVIDDGLATGDRLVVWYLNYAWEYDAPLDITVDAIALGMAALVNATDWSASGPSLGVRATVSGATLTLTAARYGLVDTNGPEVTLASGMPFTGLAAGDDFDIAGVTYTVATAGVEAMTITGDAGVQTGVSYLANRGGEDGNLITCYNTVSGGMGVSAAVIPLSGGAQTSWRVTLDFTALGIDSMRQCWFTFAPLLAAGAYADTEWAAVFSKWSVASDPNGKSALAVSGPGSVRVEETDSWVSFHGSSWVELNSNYTVNQADGFFSKGGVRRGKTAGDSVTVKYACQFEHDLYLGTSLYTDRGIASILIDGVAAADLDCYLNTGSSVTARRLVQKSIPAGQHTVTFTIKGSSNAASTGSYFYFDFLEAAVRSLTVAVPLAARPGVGAAVDYDTQHGYQLAPARLVWMLTQLGLVGEMDEYVGVFWWNQRKRVGATLASAAITFGGTFVAGDTIFLTIGATEIGKTVFQDDTLDIIAAHFAYFINATFTGVWAAAVGAVLTVAVRSPTPAYSFAFALAPPLTSLAGTASLAGSLTGSVDGTWEIDLAQTPVVNAAARAWHADLYAQCEGAGIDVMTSLSMELCYPPDNPPGQVFAARYPDGTAVATATGFGVVTSTQCTFSAPFLEYIASAYLVFAGLQAAAGLPVLLQFGEWLWWYFGNGSGMAYYDDVTAAAAAAALGRPLHVFLTPNDDPGANGYADANFLREQLVAGLAAVQVAIGAEHPEAQLEILLPLDVNYPQVYGPNRLGGALNFYVNIPAAYGSAVTAPFQRIKMEGLDFGAGARDLGKALRAARFPVEELSWPASACKYLVAVFNGGCPWEREELQTIALGLSGFDFWAFDHMCLFGWDAEAPVIVGQALLR